MSIGTVESNFFAGFVSDGGSARTDLPQPPQKRSPVRFTAPHALQPPGSAVPQPPQNRRHPSLAWRHDVHEIDMP